MDELPPLEPLEPLDGGLDDEAALFGDDSDGGDAALGALGGGEDGDGEDEAPVSDVELLKTAWVNEARAPELQYYEGDVVDQVKADLERQQEEVDERPQNAELNFVYNLYQQEIDRVRYVLNSYLRTRLRKIQRHAIHILMDNEMFDRLSEAEKEFAKKYVDLLEQHFNESFLNRLSERFRDIATQASMVPRPNLDSHVVVRVNETLGPFEVGHETVELNEGDVFFVSYRPFRRLLAEGKVDLL